ncbi:hypothetical protein Tco_0687667 [Tanacetum coccineum]
MGVINLNVTMGEIKKLRTVTMEFTVVKSHSPYNVILGRTDLRSLGAVASTIHSMRKFPTDNGIATMTTKRQTLQECRMMEEVQGPIPERRVTHPRIQASEPEKTTIKGKEEIPEQSNEKEETAKFGQSSPFHLDGEVNRDKKEREKDELPKAPNESKPLEKVAFDLLRDALSAIFGLSELKKYLADTNLHVHFEEIKVDKTLRFVEEPVDIIDREVKSLNRSRIPIVKSIGTRSEVEFFKGWQPLSPLQLAVEEVMSE